MPGQSGSLDSSTETDGQLGGEVDAQGCVCVCVCVCCAAIPRRCLVSFHRNVCCVGPRSKGNFRARSAVLCRTSLLPLLLLRLGRVGVACCCCSCCRVGGEVTSEVETTSGESCACCETPGVVMAALFVSDAEKLAMRTSRGGMSRQVAELRGRWPEESMKNTKLVEMNQYEKPESITETIQLG